MMPTASAVVADIIDVAAGNSLRIFERLQLRSQKESSAQMVKIDDLISRFYIKLMAKDQPGVFAQIGKILAENEISISGILQREGKGSDDTVPLVITTHETRQSSLTSCLNALAKLDMVTVKPVCIRIVDIPEDKD